MSMPDYFGDLPGGAMPDEDGEVGIICLVDHNEPNQMHTALRDDPKRADRIAGLIDHHAVSKNFASSLPLFIDVRPWGSMSTIIAHQFIRANHLIPPHVAKLLLMAILSDTLALRSITTSPADRFAVALLSRIAAVADPNDLAASMFRAKTDWIVGLGPYEMVRGDQKDFEGQGGWKFGIAVLEVTVIEPVLAQADCIIAELRCLKHEKGMIQKQETQQPRLTRSTSSRQSVWGGASHDRRKELDFVFLFVVDVVKQESHLVICGGRELALAEVAFPDGTLDVAMEGMEAPGRHLKPEQTLMHVGKLVSRKLEFAPRFFKALAADFQCHKKPCSMMTAQPEEPEEQEQFDDENLRKIACMTVVHDSVRVQRNYESVFNGLNMPEATRRATMRMSQVAEDRDACITGGASGHLERADQVLKSACDSSLDGSGLEDVSEDDEETKERKKKEREAKRAEKKRRKAEAEAEKTEEKEEKAEEKAE
eukprot:NODE_3513_length_2025_cov_3.947313.p1 GENE.NODE_3513_length_2025_cov_3.947313~~NODE_3513_length_2025_cov_3.947313.p1  ORF type:complete len:505 (-),score=191.33 NODE_3513_length_2025_cov_3.947313:511-1953(-)